MKPNAKSCVLAATGFLLFLSSAVPARGQASVAAQLERLRNERLRAAEEAVAAAERLLPERVSRPPFNSPPEVVREPALPWSGQLPENTRRFLEETFRAAGVPPELLAVGWVESRFDPRALSSKGARGAWQFMPETARRYGLVVSPRQDERTDLAKSTRAAARHLSDLYREFGDWLLALAAYHAGAERVETAIARAGTRNFWDLRPWLPTETQDYVPSVLAAMGGPSAALAPEIINRGSEPPAATRVMYALVGSTYEVPNAEE